MTNDNETVEIATIGKRVGLAGALKLHLQTDFIEQFQPGHTFMTSKGLKLQIKSYDPARNLVVFRGFESKEAAAPLVNQKLLSTFEATRAHCKLEEGEYFWFDMIGAEVWEEIERLGRVTEIERIANTEYLIVETDETLQKQKLPKKFYIPYIKEYILGFDPTIKRVETKGAKLLLESS